jgi:hypothetical protein
VSALPKRARSEKVAIPPEIVVELVATKLADQSCTSEQPLGETVQGIAHQD